MPWQLHDPVWARFYDRDSDGYTAKVDGFISRVLSSGTAEYTNRQGELEETTPGIHFHTREDCEAEIAKRSSPGVPTISERVSKT